MTVMFNVAEAKAKLSELLARAEAGEEVIIARDGKPNVVLSPVSARAKAGKRIPGAWAKYGPPEDPDLFLRPDPELEALMDEPIWPKEGSSSSTPTRLSGGSERRRDSPLGRAKRSPTPRTSCWSAPPAPMRSNTSVSVIR